MGTGRFCTFPHAIHAHYPAWWLLLASLALVLCSGLCGLTLPGTSAQAHRCAPSVAPPVANSIPLQDAPGSLLINEVLFNPASNWNCSEPNRLYSTQNDSWVEFFNPQHQALDLYAAHAQISLDGGTSYNLFAFGTAIAADGFLAVFPLYNQRVAAPTPWDVILKVGNTVIDQVKAPLLEPDQSYARASDGSTTWLYSGNPSIAASNNSMSQPATTTSTKTPRAAGSPVVGTTAQPASSGTQPAWKKLQTPPTTTPAPDLTTTTDPSTLAFHQPQNLSAPPGNSADGWFIALIVFLVAALLSALTWCWRLFRAP